MGCARANVKTCAVTALTLATSAPIASTGLAGGEVIAVFCQQRLYLFDGGVGFAERENRSRRIDRSGLDPQADAGSGQRLPGKLFAGIALARRRDVGMGEHAVGGNPVAGENAAAERRHRRNLPFRKGGIAMVMSGIGNLDADRARIDVALPRPG